MAKKKSEKVETTEIVKSEQTEAPSEETMASEIKPSIKPKEEKKKLMGVVTDCLKLNIRSKPEADAKILVEVSVLSELEIDRTKSTDKWYKVITESGVSGFCMKKFVAIKR